MDASSLAIGAPLEVDGNIVEDACWLRQNGCTHINFAELDVMLHGIDLADAWKAKKVVLMTDSKTLHHWMMDAVSRKSRLKTKATSEMLIRRCLQTIKDVISQCGQSLEIRFITSSENALGRRVT